MKYLCIGVPSTMWLLTAAFVFVTLAGVSIVRLRAQTTAVSAFDCAYQVCFTDNDCLNEGPLICQVCSTDNGEPGVCGPINSN